MDHAEVVRLHDHLLAAQPEGARHDSDVCPICVDKAQKAPDIPPASGGSGAPTTDPTHTEGGTNKQMTDISKETHEALLNKAVADAVAATDKANAALQEQVKTLTEERDALQTEKATLVSDNERLNGELDKNQVALKTATDEVATLKADIAAKEEAAQKAEVASQRAAQVKNLGLFADEYVQEKASKWADLDEAAWADRLEEWKAAKGAAPAAAPEGAPTEKASAMEGSDEAKRVEEQKKSDKPGSARRAVLGLA